MTSATAPRLALRYAVAFPALAGLLLWATSDVALLAPARAVWLDATAALAAFAGQALGLVARQDGLVLFHPDGGAIRIVQGCDALPTILVFLAAVIVAPAPWRPKVLVALLGAGALTLLNTGRLLHLLSLRMGDITTFRTAHETLWPVVLFAAAGALYLAWGHRMARRRPA